MSHPNDITSPISRAETFTHQGFRVPDPFAPRARPGASFLNALLATALFRCWHLLVFFAAWSTLITVLNEQGIKLNFQPTLLAIVGTVLGFIISYRTSSSFDRYNEGRRLWSNIIIASRTLSRTIWFHVPNYAPNDNETPDEAKARSLIEKKSAINLLEAYAVAVKHYLRGEDGIYYQDLYYLVKFLPAYRLPAGMPSVTDLSQMVVEDTISINPETPQTTDFSIQSPPPADWNGTVLTSPTSPRKVSIAPPPLSILQRKSNISDELKSPTMLPPPVTSKTKKRASFHGSVMSPRSNITQRTNSMMSFKEKERVVLNRHDESYLLPASLPPKYGLFDVFPFSLLVGYLTKRGKDVKGKRGARMRAKLRNHAVSHNIPLELSLYLSSYIAALQNHKVCDVPTYNVLYGTLNQLVDALTGLERILTTPIPFSYSIHLWLVTALYCLFLPFQIWTALKWLTIPATIILSFVFFGFIVAGEEIENPFGYDKNDLNLDHFTHNIIRNELRAVTSTPPPNPAIWAFVPENNLLFSNDLEDRVSPAEWIQRGANAMQRNLALS